MVIRRIAAERWATPQRVKFQILLRDSLLPWWTIFPRWKQAHTPGRAVTQRGGTACGLSLIHIYPELTIVHFDAHPDLYDEFEGSRISHACPFARIMEGRLAKRLVQIGIRTLNRHQREQAEKFRVEIIPMSALPAYEVLKIHGPVYISFDMDVLDPAFAPGISHREPGGMSVREAIAHLHAVEGNIVGADIVELNPEQDVSGMTATVAAKILKEILGKMIAT